MIAMLGPANLRKMASAVAVVGIFAGFLCGCASGGHKAATGPSPGPQGYVGFIVTGSAETKMKFNVSHYRDGQPSPVGKCGGKDGETLRVPVPVGPQEFALIPELEGASKLVRADVNPGKVTLVIIRLDTMRTLRGGQRIGFVWDVTALPPGALPAKIRP
jgi:hypothetical protein